VNTTPDLPLDPPTQEPPIQTPPPFLDDIALENPPTFTPVQGEIMTHSEHQNISPKPSVQSPHHSPIHSTAEQQPSTPQPEPSIPEPTPEP
jgi:hypothetical protein